MIAERLLIKGSGGKARAFGDPAVHGPGSSNVRKGPCQKELGLTSLVLNVFSLSLCVVCGVGRQLGRRWIAVVVIYRPISLSLRI